MSKIEVDEIVPRSGNNLTVGSSGQTIIVPAGATFNASNSTFTLPDGTVTAAKIASSLDLSGKTVTLPASAVTAHVTPFDDNKIVNDISTLALRQASDQNKSAYNTNSQSVDVFQDDTGIDTTTDVSRNASEYVSSVSTSSTTYAATTNLFNTSPFTDSASYSSSGGTAANHFDGDGDTNFGLNGHTGKPGFPQSATIDFGSGNAYVLNQYGVASYTDYNGPYFGSHTFQGSNDGSSWTTLRSHSGALSTYSGYAKYTFTNTTAYRYYKCTVTDNAGGYANEIYWRDLAGYNTNGTTIATSVFNATGNFTGTTITAPSSVSSMGAIITYQDQAGTNALNTDIVLQLSADGGSNYSTATLTALPDFSTGIKMAKVNDLAVTAGTQLKYKISFANQASGTKEARIRGVALQY